MLYLFCLLGFFANRRRRNRAGLEGAR
jgi:hypothetical protein